MNLGHKVHTEMRYKIIANADYHCSCTVHIAIYSSVELITDNA